MTERYTQVTFHDNFSDKNQCFSREVIDIGQIMNNFDFIFMVSMVSCSENAQMVFHICILHKIIL